MDLTQSFVDFANLGAEWVLWLLVALSVASIAVMVDRGLWFRGRDTDTAAAAAEAMHGERARWRRHADRNLIVLGTLGNNVPFVGLFGTVLGVIKSFGDLKFAGPDSESVVMSTLAEALVATAIGLLVAIPAVVAFNYFGRRLKVVLGGADELAHAVLSALYGREHAAAERR